MDVWVARQPICDVNRRIVAYELLHRTASGHAGHDISASAEVLIHSLFTIGLERLAGDKPIYINIPESLLPDPRLRLFPAERVGYEVLEDTLPTSTSLNACRDLAQAGFRLLLDDYWGQEHLLPFMELVHGIKVEWTSNWLGSRRLLLDSRASRGTALLAEKVEDNEQFELARRYEFDLYQGFFLDRPEVLAGRRLPSNSASRPRLLALLTDPNADLEQFANAVTHDPELSLLLLKWVNSAGSARRSPAVSVQDALVWLGDQESRRLLTVLLLPVLVPGLSRMQLNAILTRGRLAEMLVSTLRGHLGPQVFVTSMAAELARMLNLPPADFSRQFELAKAVREDVERVVARQPASITAGCILTAECYAGGRWKELSALPHKLGIDSRRLAEYYLDALAWSTSF